MVLKGVNKKVVEVVHPDGDYFERVIFILKDSAMKESDARTAQRAARYLEHACPPKPASKQTGRLEASGSVKVTQTLEPEVVQKKKWPAWYWVWGGCCLGAILLWVAAVYLFF